MQLPAIAHHIHRITAALCQALLTLIVVGQLSVVILRYVFGIGFIELQEAVTYSFAALVVLAIPVAQHDDLHVRVDVLRDHQSPKTRHLIDRAALILLLIPVFGLTAWMVWPDVAYSWSIFEGSVEAGGLPGVFLVKSCLPLACVLMVIQGIAGWWSRQDG
ncbi:MAG: TRAP transporter small permease subunit [Mangrovicoccus sp.]